MSSLPPDPWKALGVEKNADKSEIRKAYRNLVLKCHPDKIQDPALKALKQDEFQKVQQAYELLNDDTERAKYEEQVKLAAMKAAMNAKHMPNISVSRTPPRSSYTFYEVHTAEPKFKHSAPRHSSPVPPGKMYTHHTSAKSYEEDVSPRSQALYDEDKRARRMASYEQPSSRRDDEKREERRRREARDREDDDRRERERREKELRKADRKEREKVRDKEKRRDVEDKTSRRAKQVYVEEYEREDVRDVYATSTKVEKKKAAPSSSSKKVIDEPRAKSSSRRERGESPQAKAENPEDWRDALEFAANYMEKQRTRSKPAPLPRAQTFQEPPTYRVPSPPVEAIDDEDVPRRSMARPPRRASNEMPIRTKERSYPSSHKKLRETIEVVDTPPRGERIVPMLQKSNSMPPIVPESPPRHPVRVNTTPQEAYSRPPPVPPAFNRTGTWSVGDNPERYTETIRGVYEDSDDDKYDDRRRHRSRRTHSPEPITRRYKANGPKVEPVPETLYEPVYDHHGDKRSSRKHGGSYSAKVVDTDPAGYYYAPEGSLPSYKVKTAKEIKLENVAYARYPEPQSVGVWAA
jgi:curved DNA-binding protein CbpA